MSYDMEKEKREAIEAGEQALWSLRQAQRELDGARGWGIIDIFGGGMITSLIKRGKMQNAQQCMERASADLKKFNRELQDVDRYLNLNVGGLLGFADFFFDGFLADMLVQQKINDARRQVDTAIRGVERALDQLHRL